MGRDEDKLIRQLSLLSFLLSSPRPFAAREIQEAVEGYSGMSDETFARRFHGDRSDLAKAGIQVGAMTGADNLEADVAQLYYLSPEDFHLPAVEFTPAEQKALSVALAALEGRFAYARPLRLALTSILGGRQDLVQDEISRLPVAFVPDEDARQAGRQLSRIEDALARNKTVSFSYPGPEDSVQERTVDPYNLFFIQGHWYLIGHDHLRQAIRTFRVGRIKGPVRFVTDKPRDFTIAEDYDPEQYRARPPWLLGPVSGTATVRVGEDLAWWVKRLEPHVALLRESEGCSLFSVPFADEFLLLSWVTSLGGCSEILEPTELREKAGALLAQVSLAHAGEDRSADATPPDIQTEATPSTARTGSRRSPANASSSTDRKAGPIAAEHLARAMSLLSYLLDEKCPALVTWEQLESDLALARKEIEADLGLINLVNFGGGTYALTAEPTTQGVKVVREVMADTFSKPARLSPAMAKALLLALDLVGDTFALEGLGSLASVRDKVRRLVGQDHAAGEVVVDELIPPDPEVVAVLNQAIRDHTLAYIKHFTAARRELTERLVEPYFLFRSPDGWYLGAYCHKAQARRTFKLERIREATPTSDHFSPRADMEIDRRHSVESFMGADSTRWATVTFHPRWHTYLEERGAKCSLRPDDKVEAQVPYLDELWLVQEVVRYLGDAVLENPVSARKAIKETADALRSRYQAEVQVPHLRQNGGPA